MVPLLSQSPVVSNRRVCKVSDGSYSALQSVHTR